MNSSPHQDGKLLSLLQSLREGSISEAQLEELPELAAGSREAREIYLEHTLLVAALRWTYGNEIGAVLPVSSPTNAGLLPSSQHRQLAGTTRILRFRVPSAKLVGFAASSVLIGYFVVIMGMIVWDRAHPFERRLDASFASDVAGGVMLLELRDCEWGDTAPSMPGGQLVNRKMYLRHGLAEIKFGQGAKVIVEGPAEWIVENDNAVSLKHGSLVAQVPAQAIGFTVVTPTATVIDLGTEFGVDVDKNGRTDVQVLEGAVNVDYSSIDDKAKPLRRSVRMTAGNAKRFSDQSEKANIVTATAIAPWLDKKAIATKQIDERQNVPAETKYAATVLADRPLGYWRFSDRGDGRALDASGHGHHGEYVGFVSTKNPGISPNTSDRSIRFLGKSYQGCVRIKDLEVPASCTVELWARSATSAWNTEGWLLHCGTPNGFEICPLSGARDWQVYMVKPRVSGPRLGPHRPTDITDRFHQYAFSYDAEVDRGSMYFDGTLVDEKAHLHGDDLPREAARLTFYLGRPDPLTTMSDQFWGEGSVDELSIYGQVLTPDTVKRHYDAAECSAINISNSGATHR